MEPALPFPNYEAVDLETPHLGGHEGGSVWDDGYFNTLVVEDTATNGLGQHIGYELQPIRTGSARHLGYWVGLPELWNIFDFWVTRWHLGEDITEQPWIWPGPDGYLPQHTNGETIVSRDDVLWYKASAHHEPTDEDLDLGGQFGVTLAHWFGFELHPHNYFDYNPLGGPSLCP